MKRKIILSSGNKHKIDEIKSILFNLNIEICSKNDLGFENFEVEEDGATLEANAFKKAIELKKMVDGIVIADDTGLFVDELNGEPGIYSSRYGGENTTDKKNNELLLENLKDVPYERRSATFKTVIAIVLENGEKIQAIGECFGKIALEPRGTNGFGYDSLFVVDGVEKTFGEMSDDEKNKISHRAKALMKLKDKLEGIISENVGFK